MSSRLLHLGVRFLAVGILACVAVLALTGTAHAGGGVGGGGGGSGSSGGGTYGYPYTTNGFGWYVFDIDAGQRPDYFRDGTPWSYVNAVCRDTKYVIAFIVMQDRTQNGTHGTVYVDDGDWGTSGYLSGGNWRSYAEASNMFYSLPASLRSGYTFRNNVAWFCYGSRAASWTLNGQSYIQNVANSSVAPNAGLHAKGTIDNVKPGSRLYWWHDLRNNNSSQTMDKDVSYRVDKSGFSNGWNGTTGPSGSAGNGQAPNALFLKIYPTGGSYTVYDVTQNDVGNTLCQRLSWTPNSWNDGSRGYAEQNACARVPYNYTLTPSLTTSSSGVVDPGGTVTVTPKVDNTGPTRSKPTDWQLSFVTVQPGGTVPGGGDNTTVPCTQYKNAQTTCTDLDSSAKSGKQTFDPPSKTLSDVLSTIPDLPVGAKVCYGLSVKPFQFHPSSPASDDNVWRHSPLTCLVVAKSPVVQVRGGDLIVGRNQAGSEVRTNTKTSAGKAYGSWSEYAIIPSGAVFGMASAAGYASGVTGLAATKQQCQVSQLTFTNTTLQAITKKPECTGATANFGGYQLGGTTPSIMTRFPVSTAKTSLTVPASNTLVLDNSIDSGSYAITNPNFSLQANGLIGKGRWIVVNAPNSTVTITGDLRVDSTASLTKQQDIPQIVIIAKNIIIKDTVSQVDAWLLAVGTGTDGYLSTCDTTATPNAGQCTTKLTVNGPLQANHLYMRRTAGAGTGANSGDPAEVFNLRSDAYFWATSAAPSNNRVPTVSSKELPPRF